MIEANPTPSSLGTYTISLNVSDGSALFVTSSFELTVANTIPRLTDIKDPPPSHSIVHGESLSMNLTDFFIDDDGDTLTMTASYSKIKGVDLTIPEGIFTKPAEFQINVPSTKIEDTGTYNISIIVSDPYLASLTCWFMIDITNAAP